ncbi:MAG: ARMT1-like domain-containing protein [Euryarchaeota archaeon]|nr:ARMT1-like domain-containing protein [Euryarchaeota archaeon]
MKAQYYCSQCMAKQAVRTAEIATKNKELREKAVIESMKFLAGFNCETTPAYFGSGTHRIVRKITKNSDPYRDLKKQSTEFAEKMVKKLEINDIKTALRAALTANAIDYGADTIIDYKKTFEKMMNEEIVRDESEKLIKEIENAEKIMYFFDNAGEAVFDKKFIEFFGKDPVVVGKKGAMYNDITAAELKKMGFKHVLDCGDNVGVLKINKKLKKEMKTADLIISKGQANFESLPELWDGIFYLFKVKCRPMAEHLNLPIGSDLVFKK